MEIIESADPKIINKPVVRCTECDREVTHYNTDISPTNERRHICWECTSRDEKGFFTHRSYGRDARSGYIPR
jgi:hypothetical protein